MDPWCSRISCTWYFLNALRGCLGSPLVPLRFYQGQEVVLWKKHRLDWRWCLAHWNDSTRVVGVQLAPGAGLGPSLLSACDITSTWCLLSWSVSWGDSDDLAEPPPLLRVGEQVHAHWAHSGLAGSPRPSLSCCPSCVDTSAQEHRDGRDQQQQPGPLRPPGFL